MMDTLWGWLWWSLPWELKAVGAVILLGLAVYLWRVPPKWALGLGAAVALAIGANALAQRGWKAKEQRDMNDAGKLIAKAQKARTKAERISVGNLRDRDRYSRD